MYKITVFFIGFWLCLVLPFGSWAKGQPLQEIEFPLALVYETENEILPQSRDLTKYEEIQSKIIAYRILRDNCKLKEDYKQAEIYASKMVELQDSQIMELINLKTSNPQSSNSTPPFEDSATFPESEAKPALPPRQKASTNFVLSSYAMLLAVIGLMYYFTKTKKEKDRQISEMNILIEKKNQLLKDRKQQIEILNEELGHRVKNNLMFVSSLMRLQARRLENVEARAAIKEAENRVEAMAMVHRRLYEQDRIKSIEMSDYLTQLGDYLLKSYAAIDSTPVIKLNFAQLCLESDTAIQIGLIVNELMTNSFKHAFENQHNPTIMIDMVKKQDHIQLIYSDNGVGVPFDFNLEDNSSLGLRLIHDLTEQLNGTVEISNQDGACFQFEFEDIRITG